MRVPAHNLEAESAIAHGFFTREGGVSEGVYASLNCGLGSNDQRAAVLENMRRVAETLDHRDTPICRLYQIHSADVVTVTEPWDNQTPPEADAMVTDRAGVILGVLTADCAPVLFADVRAGVIGAAHAGWKGAIAGVLENTVAAMEALGAERSRIVAAVGPCIAQASYEVGEDFYGQFAERSALYGTFFQAADAEGRYRFDLAGFVRHRLAQSGLQKIEVLGMDTYSDERRFFSFRRKTHRDEADYGRQLSAIMLRPA